MTVSTKLKKINSFMNSSALTSSHSFCMFLNYKKERTKSLFCFVLILEQ